MPNPNKKVEVIQKLPEECFTANGFLFCYCGRCKLQDFKLPPEMLR